MKRFRIEKENGESLIITLHQPPYEDENILSRIKWKAKDVTITELKQYREEE